MECVSSPGTVLATIAIMMIMSITSAVAIAFAIAFIITVATAIATFVAMAIAIDNAALVLGSPVTALILSAWVLQVVRNGINTSPLAYTLRLYDAQLENTATCLTDLEAWNPVFGSLNKIIRCLQLNAEAKQDKACLNALHSATTKFKSIERFRMQVFERGVALLCRGSTLTSDLNRCYWIYTFFAPAFGLTKREFAARLDDLDEHDAALQKLDEDLARIAAFTDTFAQILSTTIDYCVSAGGGLEVQPPAAFLPQMVEQKA